MLPSIPATLLALALRAAPAEAAELSPPLPTCEVGVRHIELRADAPGVKREVCISPGLLTTLLFVDSKLARVELERRQGFRWVQEGEDSLALLPSEQLREGKRLELTVYFRDGAAPASATFILVVHPSQAERQVEVSRHERTVASYQQGEQQAQAEARQCREEKEHLQALCGGPRGLTGLIANNQMDRTGVASLNLAGRLRPRPGDWLAYTQAFSQRALSRVAVEIWLENQGTTTWTPEGAALVGSKHQELKGVTVWPLEPIAPGEERLVVVEAEAEGARGTFTLKLWGHGGAGTLFDGVTFP